MKPKIKMKEAPEPIGRQEHQFIFAQELYPADLVAQEARSLVSSCLNLPAESIPLLEEPPEEIEADFGLPLFPLAKILRRSPQQISQNVATQINISQESLISQVKAEGSYLNLHLDIERFGQVVLRQILERKDSFGAENLGQGEIVTIDMSSPNIAKSMSVGHLRSTVIGHSLARILEFTGHKVIKDNHLGDWGSQFGMLLKAIELWGQETPELNIEGKEVEGLLKLYVRIHEEVERVKTEESEVMKALVSRKGMTAVDGLEAGYQRELKTGAAPDKALNKALTELASETELEKAGREWFRRLEQGDKQAEEQWRGVTALSMKEFEQVYKLLGVDFDYALGESFYHDMLPGVVDEVKKQPFVSEEKGAVVADLGENLGKMVIQTKDGRSLYVTRDLATAIFRSEILKTNRILYVVGGDQKHYFNQWFEILRRMDYPVADRCEHIYFGMISLPEGKMSTRQGRVVFLKDVIDEGITRAEKVIASKNPELFSEEAKRETVARQVAIGAIIWSDLAKDMRRDIVFDWDEMLSFDGYSAPYVQYVHARAKSILDKAKNAGIYPAEINGLKLTTLAEKKLIKGLASFPQAVRKASTTYNPVIVAEHIYKIARYFNQFYKECSVLKAENNQVRDTRLFITEASAQVIKNGLYLLGIEAPDEM